MANKKDLNKGAAAATAKLFSSAGETKTQKESLPAEKPLNEKIKASTSSKQVFSFRGEKENVKAWRLYATVTGIKVDTLGSMALQEYLKNHPLKGAEKALFDEKMKS